jgi:hypothetical protein
MRRNHIQHALKTRNAQHVPRNPKRVTRFTPHPALASRFGSLTGRLPL